MKNWVRKSLVVSAIAASALAVTGGAAQAAETPRTSLSTPIVVHVGECHSVGFLNVHSCSWAHVEV